MNKVRQIQQLNQRELDAGISTSASWHTEFRDSAFIYIGGLVPELSEGDIVVVFSQFGEPCYINLVRDKETGKSRGFCYLKYEDQRSTDLAVDNFTGTQLLGRTLVVDHCRYKPRDDEVIYDNTSGPRTEEDIAASENPEPEEPDSEDERPLLKEERELALLIRDHDEDDPMKAYMVQQKRAEADAAIAHYKKEHARSDDRHRSRSHRHRHRHRQRDGSDERSKHRSSRREEEDGDSERRHKHRYSRHAHDPHRSRGRNGHDGTAEDDEGD